MKKPFLMLLLISILSLVAVSFYASHVLAGTQHGVNGMVNNASDGTDANGATVTFTVKNSTNHTYCTLSDEVGVNGNSKEANWYAQDIGNCPIQWKENDTVYIYIFKDENHTANTSVVLSKIGNDQAPTVNLSSPQFCGDLNCTGNETCLTCPQDCTPQCNNNSVCEPIPNATNPYMCENVTNCIDCFCNPSNGICEPQNGENCTSCPLDCHCPDGKCQPEYNETNLTCPQDCKCGNGICDIIIGLCFNFTETSINCPIDCPGCVCGDNICQAECNENVVTCCQDCCVCNFNGNCEQGETYANCPDCAVFCGNLICEPEKNETDENCPTDCATCGNGICEPEKGENWENCPIDCYMAKCGDKTCELAENKENCCKDCGCDKQGFSLGPIFLGKVEVCARNRCVASCCLFGFCWGIYIGNMSFGICWYYLVILAIILFLYFKFIKKKTKKSKEKVHEKEEKVKKHKK